MLESGLFSRKRETLSKNVDVNGKDFVCKANSSINACKRKCYTAAAKRTPLIRWIGKLIIIIILWSGCCSPKFDIWISIDSSECTFRLRYLSSLEKRERQKVCTNSMDITGRLDFAIGGYNPL